MENLRALLFLVAALFSVGACSSGIVEEGENWKKAACACKDAACAEQQGKAFIVMFNKFADHRPSNDVMEKLETIGRQGRACLEALGVDVDDLN